MTSDFSEGRAKRDPEVDELKLRTQARIEEFERQSRETQERRERRRRLLRRLIPLRRA